MRAVLAVLACCFAAVAPAVAQVALGPIEHPDSTYRDRFGGALACDGETLVVSERGGERNQQVYIYDLIQGRPVLQQVVSAKDVPVPGSMGERFGWSCSVDGDTLVIGAPTATIAGVPWAGAAFVYTRRAGQWSFMQMLLDVQPGVGALFGSSTSISSDRIAIGAPHKSGKSGRVSVFELQNGFWTFQFGQNGFVGNALFGQSVSIRGRWLMVGAPSNDLFVPSHTYFYEYQGATSGPAWTLKKDFVGSDLGQGLGEVVALGDGVAVATDPGHFDTGGILFNRAYTYELSAGGSWIQTQILTQPEVDAIGSKHVSFGLAVALSGEDLLVGSPSFYLDADSVSGRAYRFRRAGGQWDFIERLGPPIPTPGDTSGSALALGQGRAFVGNPDWDFACGPHPWFPHTVLCKARGRVSAFLLASQAEPYCHCAAQAPCANSSAYGGCTNSLDQAATLGAGGSTSLSVDDLQLQVSAVAHGASVVLLAGPQSTNLPFGDGRLCVAGGILRLPLSGATGHGVAEFGPGLAAQFAAMAGAQVFVPGETWHFQAAYSDPAGPCGTGTNLTNAVRVEFLP